MPEIRQPRTSGLTKRQLYERTVSGLRLERSTFDAHWEELARFVKPRRTRFFMQDKNKGDRRNQHIIDGTAGMAHRTLQSGMHAGITSPARPWFMLSTPNPDLAEFGPVKQWLHEVTQRMRAVFIQTNLYTALPIVYGDLGLFGTGCMEVLESTKKLFRCKPFAVGSYWLGVDATGRANTFFRETTMTVWQLIESFGLKDGDRRQIDRSKFSRQVLDLWDKHEDQTPIEVCHIITPNIEADPRRGHAKYYPWASCWFEKGQDAEHVFLRESGFREFPILAPRWEVTDEDIYGTDCPGMQALGGAKALQIMKKRLAQAVEKALNPPLQAPPELRSARISSLPGEVTFVAQREAHGGIRPVHEVRPDLSGMIESLVDERDLIREAFYADLFLMLQRDRRLQPPTAREIEERHEEKVFALGPVLERTNDDLLDPLVDRTFAMMLRAGLIPEPPQDLQGVELKVEYTSVLAAAMKSVGVAGQDRFIQSVAFMVEAFPEVRHKLNAFQAVDTYADMTGVDPRLIRSDEEAQRALDAERQAIQAQAEAEQIQRMAAGTKALGETPMEGDTALTRLVGAANGQSAAA